MSATASARVLLCCRDEWVLHFSASERNRTVSAPHDGFCPPLLSTVAHSVPDPLAGGGTTNATACETYLDHQGPEVECA